MRKNYQAMLARIDGIGPETAKAVCKERPHSHSGDHNDNYRWLFWAVGRARELKADSTDWYSRRNAARMAASA